MEKRSGEKKILYQNTWYKISRIKFYLTFVSTSSSDDAVQMGKDPVIYSISNCFVTHHIVKYSTQREKRTKNIPSKKYIYLCGRTWPLTDCVCVAVVMQASCGYRLAAKQRIALKAVTEFFQEPEHIGDTADHGQSQGMLLLVKIR